VRPDHYVYGTLARLDEGPIMLGDLEARLRGKSRVGAVAALRYCQS
jgi:hypothetical protein